MKMIALVSVALMALMVGCGSKGTESSTTSNPNGDHTSPSTADPSTPNSPSAPASSSGSNSGGNEPTDAGVMAPTDQATCVKACQMQYPKAAALNAQLDTQCFTGGACESVCDDLQYKGMNFSPSADAGAACNTADAGAWDIAVPSQNCAVCLATTPTCCNLWVEIFGSPEGQNLSTCSNNCYTQFKN